MEIHKLNDQFESKKDHVTYEKHSHFWEKLTWAMNPEHPEEKKIVNESWQEGVELLTWDMRLKIPYFHEEFIQHSPLLNQYIIQKKHTHLVTPQDLDGKHHFRVFQLHMNTVKYHNDTRDIHELTHCPHIAWDVRQYANIVSKRFEQYVCKDSVIFSDSLFRNVSELLKEKLFYLHPTINQKTSPTGEVLSLYTLTVDENWWVHVLFAPESQWKDLFFQKKIGEIS